MSYIKEHHCKPRPEWATPIIYGESPYHNFEEPTWVMDINCDEYWYEIYYCPYCGVKLEP